MVMVGQHALIVALTLGIAQAQTACPFITGMSTIEKELGSMKLKFVGVEPKIIRMPSSGPTKIVITASSHEPTIEEADGAVVVTSGTCGAAPEEPASVPPPADNDTETSAASSFSRPSVLAMTAATLAATKRCPYLGFAAGILGAVSVRGDAHADCTPTMEVEVHTTMTMADVDAYVSQQFKTGQFRDCPPESGYHKFHPDVYKGYEGCASDAGLNPCGQDGFGGMEASQLKAHGGMSKPYEFDMSTGTCVKTNRTLADEILWILWGLPMDTAELVKRTGMNPVVYFPLTRGAYPSHGWGGSHGDEGLDAKAVDDDWLEYLGAFTKSELQTYKTTLTEGTEQGMGMIYAAMMVHIASTSCNRNIYLLVEAPTYGYNMGAAVDQANKHASKFYSDASCSCYPDDCKKGTITLTRVGYFPGQTLPTAKGDDGLDYDGASTSDKSPWFERMVWPENPTGETRTAVGPTSRLVCDGCYIFPPYFKNNKIPIEKKPKCAAWAFSLTKIYSATIRTGTLITLKDHPISDAMDSVASDVHAIHNGIYSSWTHEGMNQVKQMLMAKPISDPTSWIGAYNGLMKDKWDIMFDALAGCPYIEITNGPLTGAYVWMKKKGEYKGLNKGWLDSFFGETMGVHTTSYNFGFRGTTASDYYGAGFTNDDFTRMQLYRDISVYKEVARRAKIVCGGGAVEHALGTWLTAEEWKASKTASRRLTEAGVIPASSEERAQHLKDAVPRLKDAEAKIVADWQHKAHKVQEDLDKHCEPLGYPMSCLFKYTGTDAKDIKIADL
jgi:hypothetical protein